MIFKLQMYLNTQLIDTNLFVEVRYFQVPIFINIFLYCFYILLKKYHGIFQIKLHTLKIRKTDTTHAY